MMCLMCKGEYEFLYVHNFCGQYLIYKRDYNDKNLVFLCAVNSAAVVRETLYKWGVEYIPQNDIIPRK